MALNFTVQVTGQMHDNLRDADREFSRNGGEVSRKLERSRKRLPAGKLDKHRDAVSRITKENKELSTGLSDLLVLLREAQDAVGVNDTVLAREKISEAKTALTTLGSKAGKITERPKPTVSIPRELPTRPSKGQQTKPRTSYPKEAPKPVPRVNDAASVEKSLLGRIAGKIKDIVPDVLAEEATIGNVTYDIPSEIVELAAQLNHNPAKIYAYVRDSVEYTPYYGYMKGSLWTLWEGAGNDMDQAALLSDLLRASGYETRFAIGTIEVEPAYLKLVLGVNTTEEALSLLWENAVPAELTPERKILVEHAWVEARLPYGMYSGECYRGYIADIEACGSAPLRWVPLDPSFTPYKPKKPYPAPEIEYNLTGVFLETLQNGTYGEDYFTGLNFSSLDFAAGELMNLSDMWYAENVGSVLETMTDEEAEALYDDRPPDVRPDIIPGTTPYMPLVFESYSGIPDDYLHMINIRVVENGKDVLSFNIPSLMTVGMQLTLDYVPADESVAGIVNTQESLTDIPAYLLDYRPIVLLNGIIVAVGEKSTFGKNQELLVTITTPAQQETVNSPLTVGDYYALAFDLGSMPAENAEKVFQRTLLGLVEDGTMVMDHSVGGYMSLSLFNYYAMADMNQDLLADAMGVRWWRGSPAVAVFGYTFETDYSGSVPTSLEPGFAHIDVARNVFSLQGDKNARRAFALMAGGISSSWESASFDIYYNTTGVSTVDVMEAAISQGVRVHHLSSANLGELDQLALPTSVKESIRATLTQGYEVFVPQRQLTIGNWTGVGWLVIDFATGASAWMIGDELGVVVHGAAGFAESGKEYYQAGQPNGIANYNPGDTNPAYPELIRTIPPDTRPPLPSPPPSNPSPTESKTTWEKRTHQLNSYTSTIGGKTYNNKVPDTTKPDPVLGILKAADYAVSYSEIKTDVYGAIKKSEYLSEMGRAGAFKKWANEFGTTTAKGEGYLAKSKASSDAAKAAYKEVTKASKVSRALGTASALITAAETTINVKRDLDKGHYNNAVIDSVAGATKYGIAAGLVLATPVGWGVLGAIAVGVAAIAATALVDEGANYLKRKYGE